MNNEEKILTLLEGLTTEVKGMNTRLTGVENTVGDMKADMNEMKAEIKDMNSRLANVEEKVTGIELTLENKTNKNIQILVEGHQGLVGRVWGLPDELEEVKETVSVLKFLKIAEAQSEKK
jgi:archaellum component FlaC